MVTAPAEPSDVGWRTEPDHDPSDALRHVVSLRDRFCDGPTQPRSRASTCDLDHDRPHPDGPTSAWLVSRSRRTHLVKHDGWTPIRTAGATLWTSPAGQLVEVPHHVRPAPGVDTDRTRRPVAPPDPDQLAAVDSDELTALDPDDWRPWLPPQERAPHGEWSLVEGIAALPPPF